MTSREMVQDSATRNQRTLADAVVATNRFRELDARFKSHDGMDLDPSTPEIESGYEFNRRSIEDDRAADDRNSISDQDTGRTLISITVALGLSVAVAVYMNLVLKIDPTDHLEFIYAVSLPCWCCGFWKPHGLPFEQFALLWLQHQLSDNRLFYKPSMFKSGFVKTPDEITQSRKGKLYDKSTRKFLDGTNGLEAYSPRAGRVIY